MGAESNVGSAIARCAFIGAFVEAAIGSYITLTCGNVVLTLCKCNCWYFSIKKHGHTIYVPALSMVIIPYSLHCDVPSSAFVDVPTSKLATYVKLYCVVQPK